MSLSLPPDQLNALWNEFLELWPLEKLSNMPILKTRIIYIFDSITPSRTEK